MGSNQTFLSLFTICSLAILANLFLGFLAHCTLIPQYCTLHTAHCTIHNPQYQCPFRLDIYLLKFDFWFRNGQIGGPRGCYSSFFFLYRHFAFHLVFLSSFFFFFFVFSVRESNSASCDGWAGLTHLLDFCLCAMERRARFYDSHLFFASFPPLIIVVSFTSSAWIMNLPILASFLYVYFRCTGG
jgi:hypothetical protein